MTKPSSKPKDTDEQFLYKTRKKAIGPYKKQMWHLPEEERAKVRQALGERFELLFTRLGVLNTKDAVTKFVNTPEQHRQQQDFGAAAMVAEDVSGLAD